MAALSGIFLRRRGARQCDSACRQRPHGRPFQTPFAKPRGVGQSSSTANVIWGFVNLIIGYLLVCRVGDFDLRSTADAVALGLGMFLAALGLARRFGTFNGGNSPGKP